MAIYAIADLHLSFSVDKPMDVFGEHWEGYEEKIKDNWLKTVNENDLVLIPGDISWAMHLRDAKIDLKWIDDLPGKKLLLKGNHDYWWSSLAKMEGLFESVYFLHNNYFDYNGIAICGTRGWLCPNENKFTEHDEKIYKRELARLTLSLDSAKKNGFKKIIVMMHYPPTNDQQENSGFIDIFKEYNITKVIYGHLHTKNAFNKSYKGIYDGIDYVLVSSDYLNFDLVKITDF